MNNENNQEPQLTPIPEENTNINPQPQVNPQPQTNSNTIKSIDPKLNDKVKNADGSRIDTVSGQEVQIHTEAFETEHKQKEAKTFTHDGPSKGMAILLVLFSILLIAFVVFLPDLSTLVSNLKDKGIAEDINTGKLICTYGRTSDIFNFNYTETFEFKDKKLNKFTYKEEVVGSDKDIEELAKINNTCAELEKNSGALNGIDISCQLLANKFIRTEIFNYNQIGDDNSKVKTAYVEGGGTYPEFKLGDNIDDVEVSVKQAGYKCDKIK